MIRTMQQDQTFVPSYEQHATTITTQVPSKFEVIPPIGSREHYATTITTDLPQKYQPVDLTISVPVPPKFLQALRNITEMEGTKVTFEGIVTGEFGGQGHTQGERHILFQIRFEL